VLAFCGPIRNRIFTFLFRAPNKECFAFPPVPITPFLRCPPAHSFSLLLSTFSYGRHSDPPLFSPFFPPFSPTINYCLSCHTVPPAFFFASRSRPFNLRVCSVAPSAVAPPFFSFHRLHCTTTTHPAFSVYVTHDIVCAPMLPRAFPLEPPSPRPFFFSHCRFSYFVIGAPPPSLFLLVCVSISPPFPVSFPCARAVS